MKQLNPYLIFPGTCEQALTFYKECFQGEITSIQTFADSPVEAPDDYQHKVFNSEFRAEGILFMASDNLPSNEVIIGNNFSLFATFTDEKEQAAAFAKLSEGGEILFPLQNNFGMLVDKYGIQWMLSASH